MRPTLWQTLDQTARRLIPFGLSLLLLLLAIVPMTTPGFLRAGPMITLLCVYYWAVHRPDMMGYLGGFSLGLLEDILMNTPLGVSSLILMLTQMVVLTQYRFFVGRPFLITWWALALVALGAILLKALAIALLSGYVVAPGPLIASYVLTLLLYPILAWVFARTQILLTKEP
ncbi:rod shape-determining protein MreD [Roseospira goensis]|uniref:Rod shape-determining protein MreD n=1 Tax=Roseospira goensis TaxID=391922 RepID=A0A7W6WJR2_9PROT|nr:rod shape-determining protein MreD [Roseospira goensis]MBB4285556.1 rod shape-determining protein MreD [Roseospira goensis]